MVCSVCLAADDGGVDALHAFYGALLHAVELFRCGRQILAGGFRVDVADGAAGGFVVPQIVVDLYFGTGHGHSPLHVSCK